MKKGVKNSISNAQARTFELVEDYNNILEMLHQILALAVKGHGISPSTGREAKEQLKGDRMDKALSVQSIDCAKDTNSTPPGEPPSCTDDMHNTIPTQALDPSSLITEDAINVTNNTLSVEALDSLPAAANGLSRATTPTPSDELASLFFGNVIQELITLTMAMPRHHFYGMRFGFQYPKAMVKVFDVILTAMASFSHVKDTQRSLAQMNFSNLISSVRNNAEMLIDKRIRGNVMSEIGMKQDISLLKSFWDLTENTPAKHAGKILAPFVAINRVLLIPAEEVLVSNGDGTAVKIVFPPDSSKPEGFKDVQVRLISYAWNDGQVFETKHLHRYEQFYKENKSKFTAAVSPGLVIHFHGGGFLSQSSQSHEIYLRHWAKTIGVPILSVDYSLAPEFPYPRALNECFHVYCWALANAHMLGSSAERVVLAGDSAGGNLTLVVALKALLENVQLPTALMPVYPCTYMCELSSPARLLSIMDPLLPLGVLFACMESYTTPEQRDKYDVLLSPALASDSLLRQLPPVYLAAAELDPLLDDSVTLAHRLYGIGHPMEYRVFEQLPHGFLSLVGHSEDCRAGAAVLEGWLMQMLHTKDDQNIPESHESLNIGTLRDSDSALPGSRSSGEVNVDSSQSLDIRNRPGEQSPGGRSAPESTSSFFDDIMSFTAKGITTGINGINEKMNALNQTLDQNMMGFSTGTVKSVPSMTHNSLSQRGASQGSQKGVKMTSTSPTVQSPIGHLKSQNSDSSHDVPLNSMRGGNSLNSVKITISKDSLNAKEVT
ncbi:hypothetical protein SARC_08352 [Sphaeroforma arctica JP610]|uniref:Hormone-sensitive lipase n=1 Tax=Sphaeroforma arctica JP610 TaxID=667725 RepID=A0A0L0FR06_9EUKA|nr:hypothetical protein SARC_08352 [Sphaeroforma arctica JP610]KNC79242.1 hypothetical protein SARC_08352 [Sphaeroforma arctica JP610]|eukprot:XP_014153144.1 hypothetical protein SARC_08352 [Sphaeroforma arctica JP610]